MPERVQKICEDIARHYQDAVAPNGFKDATTDPDQVRGWWTKTPRANIGIAAGLSGLIIPDLDVKNGDDGPGNYSQLLAEHGLDLRLWLCF